jgi:hypothetical protein
LAKVEEEEEEDNDEKKRGKKSKKRAPVMGAKIRKKSIDVKKKK